MDDACDEARILCVDDEPRVLEGMQRTLGMRYDVHTAEGGTQALELLESEEPFALTISDMRMPGMDGATYLTRAAEASPDMVRMLLTGQSDMEAAIRAINQGRIFRFLTKPCEGDTLQTAVEDALEQHRLIIAEKQLLQQTLFGCIKVLSELLSLSNPVAYNHGCEVTRLLKSVAEALKITEVWQMELAVMLAHLGYVGMSPELLQRAFQGKELTPAEKRLLSSAPRTAHSLLEGIPRLDEVLGILSRLADAPPRLGKLEPDGAKGRLAWGAHLISCAERVQQLRHDGAPEAGVLDQLRAERVYDPRVLEALESIRFPESARRDVLEVSADKLRPGMILMKDACTGDGVLLAKTGQEVTPTVIKLMRRMADRDNLREPLTVSKESRP